MPGFSCPFSPTNGLNPVPFGTDTLFKQRIKNITRRNCGHAVQAVIGELRRYAVR
jgi:hypothetical protein